MNKRSYRSFGGGAVIAIVAVTSLLLSIFVGIQKGVAGDVGSGASNVGPRPVPPGVIMVAEVRAKAGPVLLTPKSKGDVVDVVSESDFPRDYLRRDAFGYGESTDKKDLCLLVSVRGGLHGDAKAWKQWMLCGKSPIIALQAEKSGVEKVVLVKYLKHSEVLRNMPGYIAKDSLGGAMILQTEGGNSALYMNRAGPAWKELPGGG